MKTDRSMLDFVGRRSRAICRPESAPRDRVRLDEYLDHVREIERRIQRAEQQAESTAHGAERAGGRARVVRGARALLFDLLAVAYQADLTRVFTFMLGRELSQRTYPHIGVTEPHHSISHHGNRPQAIEAHAKVNTYHLTLFAKFVERLRSTPDGDGSLLDQSLILYGSGMGNGNVHSADLLPTLLVGGAAGSVKGGRHIVGGTLDPERRSPHQHGRDVRRRARALRRQQGPHPALTTNATDPRRADRCSRRLRQPDLERRDGDVRLIDAVKAGNAATVRALSQQRALVNATEADGTTALHWAARLDRVELVQTLIRAGAPVNAKTRYAVTPLSLAAVNGSAAVVDALLKAGADANTE